MDRRDGDAAAQAALDEFRAINDWGEGVTLPRIPAEAIEDIALNRPLEPLWPEGRAAAPKSALERAAALEMGGAALHSLL